MTPVIESIWQQSIVNDISFVTPHIPTAPTQAVSDKGIKPPIICAVTGPPGPAYTAAVIVLTTHLRINGLVIPNNFPTVKNIILFQNFFIESLWKTNGLIQFLTSFRVTLEQLMIKYYLLFSLIEVLHKLWIWFLLFVFLFFFW